MEKLEQRPIKTRPKEEQDAVLRTLSPSDMDLQVRVQPSCTTHPSTVSVLHTLSPRCLLAPVQVALGHNVECAHPLLQLCAGQPEPCWLLF